MIDPDIYCSLTLHIALATTPQKQEKEFDKSVRESYFERYRKNIGSYCNDKFNAGSAPKGYETETPTLYNPLRYHLLGNYDMAYISLIDNFKFAQKLFEPQVYSTEKATLFGPHSFQCLTGLAQSKTDDLHQFFHNHLKPGGKREYFLAICNLKLNNGFLIGAGKKYSDAVIKKVGELVTKFNACETTKTFQKTDFLLLQSFSWFEISLLLFTDDPESISSILKELRGLTIVDLHEADLIIEDSLYKAFFAKEEIGDLSKINVFSDTHTYFGLNSDLVFGSEAEPFVSDFLSKDIKLRSDIECQVKPGHMHLLRQFLEQQNVKLFDLNQRLLVAGKSDYFIVKDSQKANNNLRLLWLATAEDGNIYNHVRKIKTQIQFDGQHPYHNPGDRDDRKVFNLASSLGYLSIPVSNITVLEKNLKALKIARPIRSKILKLFSNYNNGIQDVILFPFFLDFKIFMDELEEMINYEYRIWKENTGEPQVHTLETALMERIKIFQEGYNIRMLNCYQFEDITDFDLDFNSSIQQLLSVYSTMAFELGNAFFTKKYWYGPIIQLNLKETIANYNSINYYIHDLTSPEFVFATIIKEILNFFYLDERKKEMQELLDEHQQNVKLLSESDPYLWEMIELELIDLQYYLVDTMRFIISFNFDFELFYYWFWTYNFQNSSLYNKTGGMNEIHFKKELFRILFIGKLLGFDTENLKCPLPEIFTFWDRHFKTISKQVNRYHDFLKENDILRKLLGFLFKFLDKTIGRMGNDYRNVPSKLSDNIAKVIQQLSNEGIILTTQVVNFLFSKALFCQDLADKTNKYNVDNSSLFYFQCFMYYYLDNIYKANNKTIALLRRNWLTGQPLKCFLQEQAEHLYVVDQTGGLFFDDLNNLNIYFRQSAAMLDWLWNYSLKHKKIFIVETYGRQ
ncbi:MAG: hypothetical protein JWN76_2466 [Chitinophagaceae bacterium]|nr:hypothetical protein [Chitinophagaceae bacterium]